MSSSFPAVRFSHSRNELSTLATILHRDPWPLRSSLETPETSPPLHCHLRIHFQAGRHLPSTTASGSPSRLDVASPPLPPLDSHRIRQHGPRCRCSPSLVQQRRASTTDSSARSERDSPLRRPRRCWRLTWFSRNVRASHSFFCFSGDEHECGAVELITDLVSPRTQPSPTTTMPLLHLQQTQRYGTLP
jgi:hypothetical protein